MYFPITHPLHNISHIPIESASAFTMTGTYRNMSNEIWDPHPQYNLEVFGRQLHLVLRQDASFIHNNSLPRFRVLKEEEENPGSEEEADQRLYGPKFSAICQKKINLLLSVAL